MKSKIVTHTPDPERIIEYCARASSPKNQEKMERGDLTPGRLLRYCADHGHWSVFEMANVVVEVNTTRAISSQILRHRSFSFQEFSQRYAEVEMPEMRLAGSSNRQSSTEVTEQELIVNTAIGNAYGSYKALLEEGVARETARMILPMCSPTMLYMNGTIRSWIHYFDVRCKEDVQKEHRELSLEIRGQLAGILPICAEVFKWNE